MTTSGKTCQRISFGGLYADGQTLRKVHDQSLPLVKAANA